MKNFLIAIAFIIGSVVSVHADVDFEVQIEQDAYYMDCEYVAVTVELVAENYPQTVNIVIQNSVEARRRGAGDIYRQQMTFQRRSKIIWGGTRIRSFWRLYNETYEVRVTSDNTSLESVVEFTAKPIPFFMTCKNP